MNHPLFSLVGLFCGCVLGTMLLSSCSRAIGSGLQPTSTCERSSALTPRSARLVKSFLQERFGTCQHSLSQPEDHAYSSSRRPLRAILNRLRNSDRDGCSQESESGCADEVRRRPFGRSSSERRRREGRRLFMSGDRASWPCSVCRGCGSANRSAPTAIGCDLRSYRGRRFSPPA